MKMMNYKDYAFFIIGNGFDLHCNYRTSFNDYLEYVKNKNDELSLDFITFIHLAYQKYSNEDYFKKLFSTCDHWFDVESNILKLEKKNIVKETIDLIEEIATYPDNKEQTKTEIEESCFSIGEKALMNYVLEKYYSINKDYSLYNEIIQFENHFKEYLMQELERKEKEKRSVQTCELFEKIRAGFREGIVFNFNYTDTIDSVISNKYEMRHVHGTIHDSIIIGVDTTKLKNDKEISKTYRALDLKKESSLESIPNNPQAIVFYGHSLNEQDYSYFQALFDNVNLYSNDVRLIFYYSNYRDDSDEFLVLKDRVIKLIEKYGETLENKDHGKNLLHKLILEERIVFREI